MKIANKENAFKKVKVKVKSKQFKTKNINSENWILIGFVESVAAEKLLLERNDSDSDYGYDYMRIDFEEFAQSLKSNFDELFNERLNEVNNRKLTFNYWTKEVKELFKIRKLFLQNILTN